MRAQAGERRSRHPVNPSLPRPQEHSAHRALHRTLAGAVSGFLAVTSRYDIRAASNGGGFTVPWRCRAQVSAQPFQRYMRGSYPRPAPYRKPGVASRASKNPDMRRHRTRIAHHGSLPVHGAADRSGPAGGYARALPAGHSAAGRAQRKARQKGGQNSSSVVSKGLHTVEKRWYLGTAGRPQLLSRPRILK